jgi:para-nitrobenzyl esterase
MRIPFPKLAVALAVLGLVAACGTPDLPTSPSGPLDPTSQRSTALGEVVGAAAPHNSHAWLGLPFAAPPLGDLRWRAPRPPEPWQGRREARSDAESCIQFDPRATGELIGSEDCLYLNVYAPRMAPNALPTGSASLPVMVWIHGGGNTVGAPSQYDPTRLVSSHRVIVVTTAYRLGALGWFRHASLAGADGSAEDRSGNYGILDQLAALQWVKQHIRSFGGDPGNVTVFGESAGGRDVASLVASPLAEGLFQRAIVQSGGARTLTPAQAEHYADATDPGLGSSSGEILLRLMQDDGSADDRAIAQAEASSWKPKRIAEYLRGKTPRELLEVYPGEGLGMYEVPQMFRDGTVLPGTDLYTAYSAGRNQAVPVIFGTNRDEEKLFLLLDDAYVWKLFGVLPRLRDASRFERDAAYRSQLWRVRGADELASALQRGGGEAYVYRFDWDELPSRLGMDFAQLLGAAHALELPFVFGNFDTFFLGGPLYDESNEHSRTTLSLAMMSYWVEFAKTGKPGRGVRANLPAWTAWDPVAGEPEFLVLDSPGDGGIRMRGGRLEAKGLVQRIREDGSFESEAERCALLDEMARPGDLFDRGDLTIAGCPEQLAAH